MNIDNIVKGTSVTRKNETRRELQIDSEVFEHWLSEMIAEKWGVPSNTISLSWLIEREVTVSGVILKSVVNESES